MQGYQDDKQAPLCRRVRECVSVCLCTRACVCVCVCVKLGGGSNEHHYKPYKYTVVSPSRQVAWN